MEAKAAEGTFEKKDPKIRRVVTGHDAEGKSCVWLDGYATNLKFPNPRMVSALLWCCESVPADFMGEEDMGNRILGTAPLRAVSASCSPNWDRAIRPSRVLPCTRPTPSTSRS